MSLLSRLYHRIFHVPYLLHVDSDNGAGEHAIIFLHGIASDSGTWSDVLPHIAATQRCIAIDLLGFGKSPKPTNSSYTTAEHAAAVIKTIKRLGIQNCIIAGHSMGGLVAIEIAKQQPNFVSGLVLVSVPLYNPGDIIEATSRFKGSKRSLSNGLFAVYERILSNEAITLKAAQAIMKLAPSSNNFVLTKDTWQPFKKSLTNTIMKQNSMIDILGLEIPMILVYGKLDLLVQPKNYHTLMNASPNKFTLLSYTGAHMINKNGAELVAQTIMQLSASITAVKKRV